MYNVCLEKGSYQLYIEVWIESVYSKQLIQTQKVYITNSWSKHFPRNTLNINVTNVICIVCKLL